MCAKTRRADAWADSSRRLRSFHAGSVLWKTPGRRRGAVPADAEAVPVRGLDPQPRVLALHHERVLRLVEQVLQQHRRTRSTRANDTWRPAFRPPVDPARHRRGSSVPGEAVVSARSGGPPPPAGPPAVPRWIVHASRTSPACDQTSGVADRVPSPAGQHAPAGRRPPVPDLLGDQVRRAGGRGHRRGGSEPPSPPAVTAYSPRSPVSSGQPRPSVRAVSGSVIVHWPPVAGLAVPVEAEAVPERAVRRLHLELVVDHRAACCARPGRRARGCRSGPGRGSSGRRPGAGRPPTDRRRRWRTSSRRPGRRPWSAAGSTACR